MFNLRFSVAEVVPLGQRNGSRTGKIQSFCRVSVERHGGSPKYHHPFRRMGFSMK